MYTARLGGITATPQSLFVLPSDKIAKPAMFRKHILQIFLTKPRLGGGGRNEFVSHFSALMYLILHFQSNP